MSKDNLITMTLQGHTLIKVLDSSMQDYLNKLYYHSFTTIQLRAGQNRMARKWVKLKARCSMSVGDMLYSIISNCQDKTINFHRWLVCWVRLDPKYILNNYDDCYECVRLEIYQIKTVNELKQTEDPLYYLLRRCIAYRFAKFHELCLPTEQECLLYICGLPSIDIDDLMQIPGFEWTWRVTFLVWLKCFSCDPHSVCLIPITSMKTQRIIDRARKVGLHCSCTSFQYTPYHLCDVTQMSADQLVSYALKQFLDRDYNPVTTKAVLGYYVPQYKFPTALKTWIDVQEDYFTLQQRLLKRFRPKPPRPIDLKF